MSDLRFIHTPNVSGILVIRIWYLFQSNRPAQISIIIGFLISVLLSLVFFYLSLNRLEILSLALLFPKLRNEGCKAARPPNFWHMYLPSLVLHTIMYIMTGIRALRNRRFLTNAPILKRLLRDGGLFYFVVLISVGLTAIGSMLEQYPLINIPSIYSFFLLTTTSVAMSRLMFSIHSLADKLGSNSAWLLNSMELSRVRWRNGAHEGELLVEITPYANGDVENLQRS
ncbi:hypothetical protein H2248_001518 [Termitomyces sp. 'cryptogamus']|nr:hypothetical protein H2248_001518 [Termitomyces sp. 'cryptogamus']